MNAGPLTTPNLEYLLIGALLIHNIVLSSVIILWKGSNILYRLLIIQFSLNRIVEKFAEFTRVWKNVKWDKN